MSLATAKCVLEDIQMLATGEWVPDKHSVTNTLANAKIAYAQLQKYETALREIATLHMWAHSRKNTELYTRRIANEALDD